VVTDFPLCSSQAIPISPLEHFVTLDQFLKNDQYKDEATRLARALASSRGVKLSQGAARDAVARLHGARDWDDLIGRKPKNRGWGRFFGRLGANAGRSQLADRRLTIRDNRIEGVEDDVYFMGAGRETPLVDWDRMSGFPTLVVGNKRCGSAAMVESVLAQHVAKGGAFIVLRSESDHAADARLAAIMKATDCPLYRYDPQHPETSHSYDLLGSDENSYRKFLELSCAKVRDYTTPTFDGGGITAWRERNASCMLAIQDLFEGLVALDKPWCLSDVAALFTSPEACTRLQEGLAGSGVHLRSELTHRTYRVRGEELYPFQWLGDETRKFCSTPRGKLIDGYCHHFNLSSARSEAAGVVLSPPILEYRNATQGYRRMLVEDMLAHLDLAIKRVEAGGWEHRLMIVIEDAAELGVEKLNELMYKSRTANYSLILMTEYLAAWGKHEKELPAHLLDSSDTRVFFRASAGDADFLREQEQARRKEDAPVQPSAFEDLEYLEDGEALVYLSWRYGRVNVPAMVFEQPPVNFTDIGPPTIRREGRPLRISNWVGLTRP
jgi:hypothetical protein